MSGCSLHPQHYTNAREKRFPCRFDLVRDVHCITSNPSVLQCFPMAFVSVKFPPKNKLTSPRYMEQRRKSELKVISKTILNKTKKILEEIPHVQKQ